MVISPAEVEWVTTLLILIACFQSPFKGLAQAVMKEIVTQEILYLR